MDSSLANDLRLALSLVSQGEKEKNKWNEKLINIRSELISAVMEIKNTFRGKNAKK